MNFKLFIIDSDCFIILFNGIIIYGIKNSLQITVLTKICNNFPDISKNLNKIVNISKNEHLQIFLMNGWKKHKILFKIYDLFQKNRKLIDKIFDKFHEQGRMN